MSSMEAKVYLKKEVAKEKDKDAKEVPSLKSTRKRSKISKSHKFRQESKSKWYRQWLRLQMPSDYVAVDEYDYEV